MGFFTNELETLSVKNPCQNVSINKMHVKFYAWPENVLFIDTVLGNSSHCLIQNLSNFSSCMKITFLCTNPANIFDVTIAGVIG